MKNLKNKKIARGFQIKASANRRELKQNRRFFNRKERREHKDENIEDAKAILKNPCRFSLRSMRSLRLIKFFLLPSWTAIILL
jgi:hypothetical protein